MLEKYFSAPKTLRRLRTGLSGSYIDGFADTLESAGYSKASCSLPAQCGASGPIYKAPRG